MRLRRALVAFVFAISCKGNESAATPDAMPPPVPDAATECPPGYADCDGIPITICETRIDSDPTACGACGKVCPPAGPHQVATCAHASCGVACAAGYLDCDGDPANGCESPGAKCGVQILASYKTPGGIALDETFVYYASKGTAPDFMDGAVWKVPKSGGASIELAVGLNRPLALTTDAEWVYCANGGHTDRPDGSIVAIPKGGGAPRSLLLSGLRPNNPVISGDQLFFTLREIPNGRVLATKKDGSTLNAPVEIATGLAGANDFVRAGNGLVWSTTGNMPDGSDARVEAAAFDGSNRRTLAQGIPVPSYQTGVLGDAIFVGSGTRQSLERIDLASDGGAPITLATMLGTPQEVVADASWIYMTISSPPRVIALRPIGSAPIVVADQQSFPSYLGADATHIYWTDGLLNEGTATVKRTPKLAP